MAPSSNSCFDSINMVDSLVLPGARYIRSFDSRNGCSFGDLLGPPSIPIRAGSRWYREATERWQGQYKCSKHRSLSNISSLPPCPQRGANGLVDKKGILCRRGQCGIMNEMPRRNASGCQTHQNAEQWCTVQGQGCSRENIPYYRGRRGLLIDINTRNSFGKS